MKSVFWIFWAVFFVQFEVRAEGTRLEHSKLTEIVPSTNHSETESDEYPYAILVRKFGEDSIHRDAKVHMGSDFMFMHPKGTDELIVYSRKAGAAKYKIIEPKFKEDHWTPSDQAVWVLNKDNVKVRLDLENLRDRKAPTISESQDSSIKSINQVASKFGYASSSIESSVIAMSDRYLFVNPRGTNQLLVKSPHPRFKDTNGMGKFTLADPDNFKMSNSQKVKVVNSEGKTEELDLEQLW